MNRPCSTELVQINRIKTDDEKMLFEMEKTQSETAKESKRSTNGISVCI